MIKGFYNYVFGSVPAEFESDYDLEESVQRLRAVINPSFKDRLWKQVVSGEVEAHSVWLEQLIPSFRRLGPTVVFIGRFEQKENVCLIGRFEMEPLARIFMLLSLVVLIFVVAMLALFTGGLAVGLFSESAGGAGSAIRTTGKYAFFLMLFLMAIAFDKWITHKNIPRFSKMIENALRSEATVHQPNAQ
jgi:hypothetical protein